MSFSSDDPLSALLEQKKQSEVVKEDRQASAKSFDGVWSVGSISGSTLTWKTNGRVSEISICDNRTFTITVASGSVITAVLEDDDKLHWSDGDVWTREAQNRQDGGLSVSASIFATSRHQDFAQEVGRLQIMIMTVEGMSNDKLVNPNVSVACASRVVQTRCAEAIDGRACFYERLCLELPLEILSNIADYPLDFCVYDIGGGEPAPAREPIGEGSLQLQQHELAAVATKFATLWRDGEVQLKLLLCAGTNVEGVVQASAEFQIHDEGYARGNQQTMESRPASNSLTNLDDFLSGKVSSTKLPNCLHGESVRFSVSPCYLRAANGHDFRSSRVVGNLIVTNYRIFLKIAADNMYNTEELEWMESSGLFDIPLGLIEDIQVVVDSNQSKSKLMKIQTKDFRTLLIMCNAVDLQDLMTRILTMAYYGSNQCFAFAYAEATWIVSSVAPLQFGWTLYDPLQDFSRMGIETEQNPNKACPWRAFDINADYSLCPSYPPSLVFPRSITDEVLKIVAAFRKRGRVPTLSWCGGPDTCYAGIWRCSQAALGLTGSSCFEDELLLSSIKKASQDISRDLLIIDLRPRIKAHANKVGGGGVTKYDGCKLVFGGIENIHYVREAWKAMGLAVLNVSKGEVGTWLRDVADSRWYEHIGTLLRAACWAAIEIHRHKSSVLMHCSDGWDRTSQAVALTELYLDSSYRTQVGFLQLIQKEFCSFGHRFQTRLAIGEKPSSEFSPIFIQFLDCVYQLLDQFPWEFEFTTQLILRIAKDVMSNRFGTFLHDNDKDRSAHVMPFTVSLWSELLTDESLESHRNASYCPTSQPLTPVVNQVRLRVWESYWFQYHSYGQMVSKTAEIPVEIPDDMDNEEEIEAVEPTDVAKKDETPNSGFKDETPRPAGIHARGLLSSGDDEPLIFNEEVLLDPLRGPVEQVIERSSSLRDERSLKALFDDT